MPKYLPEQADSVPPAQPGRIREKRKCADIKTDIIYDEGPFDHFGKFQVEPDVLEIYRAVVANDVDPRPYDVARSLLGAECIASSGFNVNTGANLGRFIDHIRRYHVRRVAYLVLNDWTDQIIGLDEDERLRDGGHRLRAAMFMGWDEVWVDYPAPAKEVEEPQPEAV